MTSNVLIAADESSASLAAKVVRSMQLTPVIALGAAAALDSLEREQFLMVLLSAAGEFRDLRETIASRLPDMTIAQLPSDPGDEAAIRRLLPDTTRRQRPRLSEHRYQFLSGILEAHPLVGAVSSL